MARLLTKLELSWLIQIHQHAFNTMDENEPLIKYCPMCQMIQPVSTDYESCWCDYDSTGINYD